MTPFRQWIEKAFARVDSATLGVFRIGWGIAMVLEAHWLWRQNSDLHSPDYVHFHYQGFSWVRHFPEAWMTQLETAILIVAGLLVAAGIGYRTAVIVYFVGYTHLFFSEAAAYNNHFYLVCLVTGMLMFMRADASYSLRRILGKNPPTGIEPVPFWNYLLLRFQVLVVYFYGAIAKINRDWLIEMEPIRFWLQNGDDIPEFLSPIVSQEWFVFPAAWGGLFIDLVAPFLLLWRKTRLVGIVVLISFHVLNSQLFRIGFFPFIGILLIAAFLNPDFFRRRAQRSREVYERAKISNKVLVPVAVYCLFQILFPLRGYFYRDNNPSWTDAGHWFAWRMMLREKTTHVKFHFGNPRVEAWLDSRPQMLPVIAPSARIRAMEYPLFNWQYAQHVRERLANYGFPDTSIYIHAATSLNGRPFLPVIDPNVDMARATAPIHGPPDWLLPLPDDLPLDFSQIDPESDGSDKAAAAFRKYFDENPGPGEKFWKPVEPASPEKE